MKERSLMDELGNNVVEEPVTLCRMEEFEIGKGKRDKQSRELCFQSEVGNLKKADQ
jgi:hypothetical protein